MGQWSQSYHKFNINGTDITSAILSSVSTLLLCGINYMFIVQTGFKFYKIPECGMNSRARIKEAISSGKEN